MKKLLGLLFIVVIGSTACNNSQTTENSSTVDTKAEIKKLNDFLDKYAEPSQIFSVSSDSLSKVKGKQGTIISVNPADLTTENGQPIGDKIDIELKELTNQEQLLKSNVQTVSDGQLLISGGAYYINMTSNGQQLKLKDGKTLKVEFPKLTDDDMSLFYGQRDSLGEINWKQTSEKFKSDSINPLLTKKKAKLIMGNAKDTTAVYEGMTEEEFKEYQEQNKIENKIYTAINLSSFGWLNCDRFMELATPNLTDLFFKFNPSDSVESAKIFVVFKDMNSLWQSYYYDNKTVSFTNIPSGYRVRVLAYTIKDEKVYSYSSDLTVAPNETVTLTLKETNEEDFKKLLGS